MTTTLIDGNVKMNNMEDKKEIPRFIFKLPTSTKEQEEETRDLIKESFGDNCLVIFADDNLQLFQLTGTYEKVI